MKFEFNRHPLLEGRHAFLGASKSSWIRYTQEKMLATLDTRFAAIHGSRLHNWAAETIKLGIKQINSGQTINTYINDAISYRMQPEVLLRYSDNAFGTADAISFRRERKHDNMVLRIHDLKTGANRAHMEQLYVYAAFFCLEYGSKLDFKPHDLYIELRIYQNDEIEIQVADPTIVVHIMDVIQTFDQMIEEKKAGEED